MSLDAADVRGAEKEYWDSFARLKLGLPILVPKGTPVSQNNVAKEAGRDPSALRKSRYPKLIEEIQEWVSKNSIGEPETSARKKILAKRKKKRTLDEKTADLALQRDHAASLLVEADAKILELSHEVARLEALLESRNVVPIKQDRQRRT